MRAYGQLNQCLSPDGGPVMRCAAGASVLYKTAPAAAAAAAGGMTS